MPPHGETEEGWPKLLENQLSFYPVTGQELPTDNRHPQGYQVVKWSPVRFEEI